MVHYAIQQLHMGQQKTQMEPADTFPAFSVLI